MIFLAVGATGGIRFRLSRLFNRMKNSLLLSILVGAAIVAASTMHAQSASQSRPGFKIVTHPDNPFSSLTRAQISNFLLKKKSRWKNGWQVDPVDLGSRSSVRAEMSQLIHERSVASIKNYWQRQIFSGNNTPPPELETDQEVVDFVKNNRGSIGYVSGGFSSDEVKVVNISD